MVFDVLRCIIYALERREGKPLLIRQTLRSRLTLSRTYESRLTCQQFIVSVRMHPNLDALVVQKPQFSKYRGGGVGGGKGLLISRSH